MIAWWLLACGAPREELVVLAASSLTEAFGDLEARFEEEHPDVDVVVAFAGTQTLATQVRQGLAADVIASADPAHAEALAAEGLTDAPRPFAANALVLATTGDVDLARLPEVERLVVGADEVPVGRYTAAMLDAAGERYGADWRAAVETRVVSREPSVRHALAKLVLGEADAAVVYATDLAAVDGVRGVALPAELAPPTTLVHARLTSAPHAELADAWMAMVEGPEGRALLASRGFALP
ncbi:MAG: molybdate ABC transporter substrate-binding protein [Alphaproteobacteria bacterium]|nr:molybdate ABC transporter substrate-binding protein [Alphaproteobacteria bacterium]MCB9699535.1 molybdate ABC transporter substrate-binding protein [Alphaproteobacteria bacterium]